ncbi:nucleotide sugar dehydrogenase [Enterococcus faecium]|uniref:nucleotide sugar dehydrogenase n=1 Tax=Enterococcus faecium TaxID=1352 RepID=UPI0023B2BFBB|nr:nucleotide sugar dehydrogenase [Enterococcus faecium]
MENNVINFIGLGYVGLPAALMLQNSGYKIIGTDKNQQLINQLNTGNTLFEEYGMNELYEKALVNGITFTTEYQVADIYIVAVPTPFDKATKKIDPAYLISAVTSIHEKCKEGALIIIESTISPKTIDRYVRPVFKDKAVELCHAPERILPGNILYELKNNARTIGADTIEVAEKVKKIYQSFCDGKFMLTSIKVAELTKVVENTFRDVNIAFANELKQICDQEDLDVFEVIDIANKHPRVNILTPGTGVGGHCISVDPWFLVGDYPETAKLIRQAREVNDQVPKTIFDRTIHLMNQCYPGKTLGVYGLSYKNNVGDVRESPSLQMYNYMKTQQKESIVFYDPLVNKKIVANQSFDLIEFLDTVDVVLVMNKHRQLFDFMELFEQKKVVLIDPVGTLDNVVHL